MSDDQGNKPRKEGWGSRIGVILAVMGSAIGLGNFLRFPGLAAKYEGGHFMIPYFIAFLLLGLPLVWAEWSMGRLGGKTGFNSTVGIFRSIWKKNPLAPYLGVLGLIIPVGIYMYYVFIESWCLYYALMYLKGSLITTGPQTPETYGSFFDTFIGAKANGAFFDFNSPGIYVLTFCFFLNFAIVYRGLSRGIEIVCKFAIPALFLCAGLVLIRVLTLGAPDPAQPDLNVLNALGYSWNPGATIPANWSNLPVWLYSSGPQEMAELIALTGPRIELTLWESLMNAEMWLEAAGQIFFSLSVGFGIIITYSSYLKKSDDVLLSGTTSASGNIFAEVALGGLMTIPAAFLFFGAEHIRAISNSSFQIGFIAMPNVFDKMPLGQFIGFLWFFLLFLAAVTSSLSMIQPAVAFLEEGLGTDRRASVTILGFVTLMGVLFIVYFSKDTSALVTMDFWIGTFFIYLLATITILIFGWVIGAREGLQEARQGSLLKLPDWIAFVIKYISPAYLITIFVFWAIQKFPGRIASYVKSYKEGDSIPFLTLGFIILLIGFFLQLIATAVRRWKKQEASGERQA